MKMQMKNGVSSLQNVFVNGRPIYTHHNSIDVGGLSVCSHAMLVCITRHGRGSTVWPSPVNRGGYLHS